jgi:hypothetical protein
MRDVVLHEPRIGGNTATFSWDVTPRTELYHRTTFELSFPPELDLSAVPRSLWWRIMLISLHTQFAILRPCRVRLPVTLGARERGFWERLVDNAAIQIEAYGGQHRPGRAAELLDSGPALVPVRVDTSQQRTAVAFSGGKDSLVLTGLLTELKQRPLLVMITSPVEWANDQVGSARKHALSHVARELSLETVEVQSDFRTAWDYEFSGREGCTLGVHELSDLALYHGTVAAVAAARGIGRSFMASEANLQYNGERDGKVLLQPEFLSTAVTQGALDALLAQFGLGQGSLTYPVHVPQVQALLLHRYRKLAGVEFSCFRARPGQQACSECPKCLIIAMMTLAAGASPRVVGIDLVRVLCTFADFQLDAPQLAAGPVVHEFRRPGQHFVRVFQEISTSRVAALLADDPRSAQDPRLGEALAIWARLRADALAITVPPPPGYIAGFLEHVPPDLRMPLKAILDKHFEPADPAEFAAILARAQKLTDWITAPLEAAPAKHAASQPLGAGTSRS